LLGEDRKKVQEKFGQMDRKRKYWMELKNKKKDLIAEVFF